MLSQNTKTHFERMRLAETTEDSDWFFRFVDNNLEYTPLSMYEQRNLIDVSPISSSRGEGASQKQPVL